MPRGPRDYAREYQRRVELEQERAAREGRSFSRSRARGHKAGREDENTRRRVRRLWQTNVKNFGKNYPGWDSVKGAATNYSWSEVEKVLRQQQVSTAAYKAGDATIGRREYDTAKAKVYPIEFFWYHGN